jgi:hypothetical protein
VTTDWSHKNPSTKTIYYHRLQVTTVPPFCLHHSFDFTQMITITYLARLENILWWYASIILFGV